MGPVKEPEKALLVKSWKADPLNGISHNIVEQKVWLTHKLIWESWHLIVNGLWLLIVPTFFISWHDLEGHSQIRRGQNAIFSVLSCVEAHKIERSRTWNSVSWEGNFGGCNRYVLWTLCSPVPMLDFGFPFSVEVLCADSKNCALWMTWSCDTRAHPALSKSHISSIFPSTGHRTSSTAMENRTYVHVSGSP